MAAVLLVIVALGLPLNDLWRYAVLVGAAIAILTGAVSSQWRNWLIAAASVAACIALRLAVPAPMIEEGHNVFIVDRGGNALERGLPPDAYRQMLAEFDTKYPKDRRCSPAQADCWRHGGFPERAYAFSADAVYDRPTMSRRVAHVDFFDPVWLRLGAINEWQYNWTGTSDVQRNARRPWNVLSRWTITAPYFVLYRFPKDFVGSELCFSGYLLWETAQQIFLSLQSSTPACRIISSEDIGRAIIGVSIAQPLSMLLRPPLFIEAMSLLPILLACLAAITSLAVLVRRRAKAWLWPTACVGAALAVAFLNDSSFIGGVRPFDGGDDGLVYEGMARRIVQHVLAGDVRGALMGGEPVFYYGGPGLRYLRALEHFIFGDTFLGYLSLMLTMPLLVYAAFKRFLGASIAFKLTVIAFILPLGALFGSTLYLFVKWSARGFADPAAAFALLAAFIVLAGRDAKGPRLGFRTACGAGLLFALALFIRPNLAPAAAVLLSGAGLMALWHGQYARLAGLCVGFAPVFSMALHNWTFGGVFVLFSSNATIAAALTMPPSAWLSAISELITLDPSGGYLRRAMAQLVFWLSGPSGSALMIPVHAIAIAILVRVAAWGRRHDAWLRICALAALAQHPVALFYLHYERYHYVTWLLTLIVCAVWIRDEGFALIATKFPHIYHAAASNKLLKSANTLMNRLARRAGIGSDIAGQSLTVR